MRRFKLSTGSSFLTLLLACAGRPTGSERGLGHQSQPHAAAAPTVPRFGIFETALRHSGKYANPYVETSAEAQLLPPDGSAARRAPLFWDGQDVWRFRFSPDQIGVWTWTSSGADAGLGGKSGSFRVVPSSNPGGLAPMAGHPHHFQRQNGSRFWFFGDTAWALFTDSEQEQHNRGTAQTFIARRAGQGFNVMHAQLLGEAGWPNSGGPPFEGLAGEQPNPAYWQEIDRRLAYANSKGISVGLTLAWALKRVNPNSWKSFPSVAARKRYARYATARYAAFDVYFIVAGEWNFEGYTDEVRNGYIALGDVVRRSDPHGRMIAIHPGGPGGEGVVREFNKAGWMSFGDYQQRYSELHKAILESRPFGKPVVNSEYGYHLRDREGDGKPDKSNSSTLEDMRHATWDIAMAGGYFVTGFGATYYGGERDGSKFDPAAAKHGDWEDDVQHVRTLFTQLAWWRLEPHDELLTGPFARGPDHDEVGKPLRPPLRTYWLLAEPGRQYVAYVRGGTGPFHLALSAGIQGLLRLRRFDPRGGRFTDLGAAGRDGKVSLEAPDNQDWVFVLSAPGS